MNGDFLFYCVLTIVAIGCAFFLYKISQKLETQK